MGTIFQISDKPRYVTVRKAAKGSPAWAVQECYPCNDSPTGWHTGGDIIYVNYGDDGVVTAEDAAQAAINSFVRYGSLRQL